MENLEVGITQPSQFLASTVTASFDETYDMAGDSIALVDEYALSRFCLAQSLSQSLGQEIKIRPFPTVEEALSCTSPHIQMVVLCTHRQTEQHVKAAIEAIQNTSARVLVVTDERPSELWAFLREAIRSGICGFVSTINTEFRTLNAAIEFVLNGGIFVPPEFFMQDSAGSEEPKKALRVPDQLTNRQAEVFSKLREGKPNKLIAYELNMSESTVKVHLRNIMRTIGATNRTQAVFKAQPHHLPDRGIKSSASRLQHR
jgi:DNA-binding NarL/FixJ family response regulator